MHIMSFLKDLIGKLKDKFQDSEPSSELVIDEKISDEYLEELEEDLIRSDLGVKTSLDFIEYLKKSGITSQSEVPALLKEFLTKNMDCFASDFAKATSRQDARNDDNTTTLSNGKKQIFLIVGVNGVGKTTSIGKLANKFKNEGHKVLIAAGDTFRAAAEEQLNIWAQRAGVDIVQLEEGSKPSTVVYKAIEKLKEEDHDILIIDTAGRLQNKANLMEELANLKKVINKNLDEGKYKLQTLLVLDASTGSNALSQAEKFNEVTDLDSIILTKFDGTAKGGVVFSLAHQFKLPVSYIGTGERIEDIEEFDSNKFINKFF